MTVTPVVAPARRAVAYMTFYPYIEALPKESVALDDNESLKTGAQRANVLFVLDAGSAMTFTPTGTMPEWNINVNDQSGAGQMLKQATYGHGGLSVRPSGASRFGREGLDPIDALNNMTPGNTELSNHLNNYYSPFDYPNNPISLNPAPYALVFKSSAYWQNPPSSFTADDLMPNDSRMYKMKLVMWRVLADTVMLEKLRVGMATTFQELNGASTTWSADFYKESPWGIQANFPYGTGPSWSTGMPDSTGYGNAVQAHWGIDRAHYDRAHSDKLWKLLNRAYLRVPIAESTQEHLNQFRMWIDGYEDNSSTMGDNSKKYFFTNPELFADGKTYLSTAIYPGHPDLSRTAMLGTTDLLGKKGVIFSSRNQPTTASLYINSEEMMRSDNAVGNYFKAGSGEALGTILDFFSPPVSGIGGVGTDAENVRRAPEVSFPLSDPCDKNWVIIFTAGDDSGDNAFTSAKAVEDLYNFTKNNNLTRLAGVSPSGENEFSGIRLQDGVRTLVVGFVDPNSTAPNVAALRNKLNAVAIAGDPGNSNARAYFANDVEGLLQSLRMILARINSEIQPAKGSMLEGGSLGDELADAEADSLNFYSSSFRINVNDQWEGELTRYESAKNRETGALETKKKWELGKTLIDSRNASPGSRNLLFWAGGNGGNFVKAEYTGANGAPSATTRHPLAALSTLDMNFTPVSGADAHNTSIAADAAVIDSVMYTDTVGGDHTFLGKIHPSRSLIDWYYGYEVSYANRRPDGGFEVSHLKRRHMLSDAGNSGVSQVGPLKGIERSNPLPGFNDFAAYRNANTPTMLYFQTNDGLLHIVDAKTGVEKKAILPPPSLLPHRVWAIKARRVPAPGMFQFPGGSHVKMEWRQGSESGPQASGFWDIGGMSLTRAVEYLNNHVLDSGDTPSGATDITFSLALRSGGKAAVRVEASGSDFRLSGSGAGYMGFDNVIIPRGTAAEGAPELDYPRGDRYQWIDVQSFMTETSDDIPISSIPSFTLDGPLQVRYFDIGGGVTHKWRAIMVATLGRGGGGLYAMDVTDPDAPEYLWYHETIEGADGDPSKVRVLHQTNSSVADRVDPIFEDVSRGADYWGSVIGSSGAAPDEHPYEQLGYNSPRPAFGVARKQGVVFPSLPTDTQNIIALPGGLQNLLNTADNGKMGAAFYLIDPDVKYHASKRDSANYTAGGVRVFNSASYGGVEGKWKVGSAYAPGAPYSDPYMGMMISEPTFVTLNRNSSDYIADGVFACDNRGSIHYVSFVNNDDSVPGPLNMSQWGIRTVGALRGAGDAPTDSYANPYGVILGWRMDRPDTMWVAGGTADVGGMNGSKIMNKEQMLFSFKMPKLGPDPSNGAPPVGLSSRNGDINHNPEERTGWTRLDPDEGTEGINVEARHDGWYIRLEDADRDYGHEYATTKPIMFGGYMYAATFREKKAPSAGAGLCESGNISGESRLYTVGMDTGISGQWSDKNKKYISFDGIKITGFTHSSTGKVDTLIITYSVLDRAAAESSIASAVGSEKENGLSRVSGDMDALQVRLYKNNNQVLGQVGANGQIIHYWRFVE